MIQRVGFGRFSRGKKLGLILGTFFGEPVAKPATPDRFFVLKEVVNTQL